MKIIIDAMGGDNAPLAPLQGAAQAVAEYGVEIIAVGDEAILQKTAQENGISLAGMALCHAPDVIGMDEEATDGLRRKPGSSMAVAMKLLRAGEGDALVSAGSTGALLVGATLITGRIKGIKRAALATVIPGARKPWLLLDAGANAECRAEQLLQFAVMGSAYMEKVMGVSRPTVALANNGAEETKGTQLQLDTWPLLQASGLNFTGNIEARDMPAGAADVVVCDGFTGNIILKLTEGVAKMMTGMMKDMIYQSAKTKVAGLLLKSGMGAFKKRLDYTEYGGAPFLGLKKPVIKAHGSSNAHAIKNAVRQAKTCVDSDVCGAIAAWLAEKGADRPGVAPAGASPSASDTGPSAPGRPQESTVPSNAGGRGGHPGEGQQDGLGITGTEGERA